MPRLSEVASHLVIPRGIVSTGYAKVEPILADMGVTFDWWQADSCRVALGRRADGKYAATIGGVVWSLPRQCGKTFAVGHLLIALCVAFPGLRVIWTSHHLRTTTNTFRAMQGMVRRRRVFPHLAPNGIRVANGEQEIRFKNGSIIMFGAREQGFGRGMDAIDFLVFDEAQKLGQKALEDMVPATNAARHDHGALLFFIGTPPRPTDDGEAFALKRESAISGRSKDIMYLELSADRGADPDDRRQWAKANLSYPGRTSLESMLRMRENLGSVESWLREAMGIWDEVGSDELFGPGNWVGCLGEVSEATVVESVAVAVSFGATHAAVVGAGRVGDRKAILPIAHGPGVDWVLGRVGEVVEGKRVPVLVDSNSPASFLIDDLRKVTRRTKALSLQQCKDACEEFEQAVKTGVVLHGGFPELDESVGRGKWRKVGDRRLLDRAAGDITVLEGAAFAVYGLGMKQGSAYEGRVVGATVDNI